MPPTSVSIVTPSYNGLRWLPMAVASVADQDGPGVVVDHHVQDGGSTDGTAEWLRSRAGLSHAVERDRGMYDAVNRGFDRARGEVLAYLNCDEQYLPGALARVAAAFEADPSLDLLFGDVLVVDPAGELLCTRRVVIPNIPFILVDHLPTFTCAMFFRRRVVEERGLRFDTGLREVADATWVAEAIRRGLRMRLLGEFTTTFAETGENLSLGASGRREATRLAAGAPALARWSRPLLRLQHRAKKILRGAYRRDPVDYAIYVGGDLTRRKAFRVERPPTVWTSRLGAR